VNESGINGVLRLDQTVAARSYSGLAEELSPFRCPARPQECCWSSPAC